MGKEILQVVQSASSIDAAVSQAIALLGCSRAEVCIEILSTPSTGFLGIFGKKEGTVKVTLNDRGFVARKITEHILQLLNIPSFVEVHPGSNKIELTISSSVPHFIIGHHGNTLYALETTVNTITDRFVSDRTPLTLDVDGYRERRVRILNRLAHRLCSQVRKTKKQAIVPSMALVERKIFYDALKDQIDLECRSLGQGMDKKLILSLKKR